MGDYADMMIEGLLDEETGELIDGDAPGYPRSPTRDARNQSNRKSKGKKVKCPHCARKLKSEDGLQQHIKDVHGKSGGTG